MLKSQLVPTSEDDAREEALADVGVRHLRRRLALAAVAAAALAALLAAAFGRVPARAAAWAEPRVGAAFGSKQDSDFFMQQERQTQEDPSSDQTGPEPGDEWPESPDEGPESPVPDDSEEPGPGGTTTKAPEVDETAQAPETTVAQPEEGSNGPTPATTPGSTAPTPPGTTAGSTASTTGCEKACEMDGRQGTCREQVERYNDGDVPADGSLTESMPIDDIGCEQRLLLVKYQCPDCSDCESSSVCPE